MNAFFKGLVNKLSYTQIYLILCALFVLSLLPIIFFWIQIHVQRIQSINTQLTALDEERMYKTLFHEIQEQHLLLDDIQQTSKESSKLPIKNSELLPLTKDQDIPLSGERKDSLSDNDSLLRGILIHEIPIQIHSLIAKANIDTSQQADKYAIIQKIFLRLSYIQMSLGELILIAENMLLNSKTVSRSPQVDYLVHLISSDLKKLTLELTPDSDHPLGGLREEMTQPIELYRISVEKLLQTTVANILHNNTSEVTLKEFDAEGQLALKRGYQLWESGLTELSLIFRAEKKEILTRLWLILCITIVLSTFTCIFGLKLIIGGTRRLDNLRKATTLFSEGHLHTRLSDSFHDDIGRVCQSFNQMAERLEKIVNNLTKLQEATKTLAGGNLSARIAIEDKNNEFSNVAASFNTMADHFEQSIQRLQSAGKTLTSSAIDIAAAAKEQEKGILLQVSSTHKIALSAEEILKRTQEFTKVIQEINQNSEKTSDLAIKGKTALTEMEGIMQSLVDASNYIAATLSILNEKASNITFLTTIIAKVADQTNLLSINASIEAEKAGEFGKSFAVIAKEIRRLADQTAATTNDVEKTISEITEAMKTNVTGVTAFTAQIKTGAKQAHSVSEQLGTIIEQVQFLTEKFEKVSLGMEAQSEGAEQINKALFNLSQTADQTSDALHQFRATVQKLNDASIELQKM